MADAGHRAGAIRHVEHVMGTVFSFDVRPPYGDGVRAALDEAVALLHRVDAVFSTYRADSAISRLGRGEVTVADCGAEVARVLARCARARRETGGWFSHTAAGRLDPSGLVKGWAVERASDLLHAAGARNCCVNGGGDLQLRGEAAQGVPWRVGVAHPLEPGALLTVVEGRDLAVATSGTAERGAHITDPHTGRPATALASVTVTGRRLARTDVLATALFAMGDGARERAASFDGHEVLAVTAAGAVWHTAGFPGAVAGGVSEVGVVRGGAVAARGAVVAGGW
ncbi:FAD:protein FMN transferase [Streptantibioticus silvisoli]|uniref:FAD:protein FMN transferase n=1 Tax=Streptantibioticus silvisoli TaxID=2705255 RepID=A0ABT6VXY4_9ACTN|nr:FAD:protein FMN transferase [Streptantibioticus silvisoli]MDI5963352.1 FAD:protein FMN transferase [Streptantibioticus silvisoli]